MDRSDGGGLHSQLAKIWGGGALGPQGGRLGIFSAPQNLGGPSYWSSRIETPRIQWSFAGTFPTTWSGPRFKPHDVFWFHSCDGDGNGDGDAEGHGDGDAQGEEADEVA